MKKSLTTGHIKVADTKIEYSHRRGASRSMRLSVFPDGRVAISTPLYLGEGIVHTFMQKQATWILDRLNYFKRIGANSVTRLRSGRREYLKYREAARTLARTRLEHFNQHYQFSYGKITIRDQKSRWGSCSREGNLNFNYKIARIDPRLADYVVVHELCHVREFNHSKRFWDLVGETIPDYKALRKRLKANQLIQ